MTKRTVVVVTAGLSQPASTRQLADQLAVAVQRALAERSVDAAVEIIELRDYAHDLTNNLLTGFPSSALRSAIEGVVDSDALIAVTPIFSASYSGLFKTFFDVLEADSLAGKPTLIAATGGSARHSLALEHAVRPLFSYLRSVVVPTAVYAASVDWGSTDGELGARIQRAARELAGLISITTSTAAPDPFVDPVPFAKLLINN